MLIKNERSILERYPTPSAWTVFTGALFFTFRRIGLLMAGNLLWWLFSLPIITLPAASMGLYYLVYLLVENPDPSKEPTWRDFITGFRQYGVYGVKTFGAYLLIAAVLIVGFLFYLTHDAEFSKFFILPTAAGLLFWIVLQLYLMPLVFFHEQPLPSLAFKNSVLLSLRFPGYSFTLTVFLLLVSAAAILLAGPVMLILISFLFVSHFLATKNILLLIKEQERPTEQDE
jgi:uncharacterized membrane protein YesL